MPVYNNIYIPSRMLAARVPYKFLHFLRRYIKNSNVTTQRSSLSETHHEAHGNDRMSLFSLLHACSMYIGSIRQSNAQIIVKLAELWIFGENQPHVGYFCFVLMIFIVVRHS